MFDSKSLYENLLQPFGQGFRRELERAPSFLVTSAKLSEIVRYLRLETGDKAILFPGEPMYFGLPDKEDGSPWEWPDKEVQEYVNSHTFGGGFNWTYLFSMKAQFFLDGLKRRSETAEQDYSQDVEEIVRLAIDDIEQIGWFSFPVAPMTEWAVIIISERMRQKLRIEHQLECQIIDFAGFCSENSSLC